MAKHADYGFVSTQVNRPSVSHLRLTRFKLKVSNQGQTEQYVFDDGPVQIGTLEDNHIVLKDDTVSRKHALIYHDRDDYVLQDLNSTNGIFVNSIRLKECYLQDQMEFMLGQTKIIFEYVNEQVKITPSNQDRLGKIVGSEVKMREIFSIIQKISPTDTTIVIEGETGTGKDVVAKTIHDLSRRKDKPFIVFDCSAVPENLMESELFGHEKGAFTGAIMARQGLFELANGGTIFLDELGELSLDLQPKLLRVLENRQIRRIGSSRSTAIDVRVIAATNRKLDEEVKKGRFREDLFYRLSVVRLFLPPLRERKGDIPLLCSYFLEKSAFNRDENQQFKITSIVKIAMDYMMGYSWPGNVRELLNVLERSCSFCEDHLLKPQDLPQSILDELKINLDDLQAVNLKILHEHQSVSKIPQILSTDQDSNVLKQDEVLKQDDLFETFKEAKERWLNIFEKDYILATLKRSKYNISHAARDAQIDRKYFRKLMQKYGIEVPYSKEEIQEQSNESHESD